MLRTKPTLPVPRRLREQVVVLRRGVEAGRGTARSTGGGAGLGLGLHAGSGGARDEANRVRGLDDRLRVHQLRVRLAGIRILLLNRDLGPHHEQQLRHDAAPLAGVPLAGAQLGGLAGRWQHGTGAQAHAQHAAGAQAHLESVVAQLAAGAQAHLGSVEDVGVHVVLQSLMCLPFLVLGIVVLVLVLVLI
jgi:hypothetical protein